MKRKLTMLLMTVVMLAGLLAGCGGKSSKHVEMSDSAREAFYDYVERSHLLGDSSFVSSTAIYDYEINGAPIIFGKRLDSPNILTIIYRDSDGRFVNDSASINDDVKTTIGKLIESARSSSTDTKQDIDDYITETFPNAISIEELFSGDNVYTTKAELLDAWEEY